MKKLNILKELLGTIKESMPVSEANDNNGPVNSELVNSMDYNAEEQAIRTLSIDFAKSLNDRDFEFLDGRAEYHLYTVDHLIELIKSNDEQTTADFLIENKLKVKYESCEFLSITFSENMEQATVVYNVKTCVISAEKKYFKELNKKNNLKNEISKDTPFSTTYTLFVKKEKGTWKIDKFTI
ncbi:hypothetical protein AAC978_07430 [Desulfitobacterium sp. THU1]|uniref:hypothetical protein n=1 Tax=Desulfitobacterium sp. THU1 TaxID=3138072 RepID=UPI00311E7944